MYTYPIVPGLFRGSWAWGGIESTAAHYPETIQHIGLKFGRQKIIANQLN